MSAVSLTDESVNAKLHPIIETVRELLDKPEWRFALYLFLIVVSVVPILADAGDVFLDNYHGNQFCGHTADCAVGFVSCIFLCIGIGVLCWFKIYHWSEDSEEQWSKMNRFGVGCIAFGWLLLFTAICMVGVRGNVNTICYDFLKDGCGKYYKSKDCSEWTTDWCRRRYIGRNSFCLLIILCLIIEFVVNESRAGKQWNNQALGNYNKLRLGFFSTALAVSSILKVLTYAYNFKIYTKESMGIVTYVICVTGLSLVIITTALAWFVCACRKKIIGHILSILLLIGIVLVQAKANDDSSVKFIFTSVIAFVDIQVLVASNE